MFENYESYENYERDMRERHGTQKRWPVVDSKKTKRSKLPIDLLSIYLASDLLLVATHVNLPHVPTIASYLYLY